MVECLPSMHQVLGSNLSTGWWGGKEILWSYFISLGASHHGKQLCLDQWQVRYPGVKGPGLPAIYEEYSSQRTLAATTLTTINACLCPINPPGQDNC